MAGENSLEQKIDTYFGLMMDEIQGIKGEMQGMKSDIQSIKGDILVTKQDLQDFREEVRGEFAGLKSRMGGQDNRIDEEVFARKDLETRVRTVVPNLPLAPERA